MIAKKTAARLKARRLMSPKPSSDLAQAATVGTQTGGADSTVIEVGTATEAVPHEDEEATIEADIIEVTTIVGVHHEGDEAEVRQGEEVEVHQGDETITSRGGMIEGAMIMKGGMTGERIEETIGEMIDGMIGGTTTIDGIDDIR